MVSVADAASSGDRRRSLEAIRDRLAAELDDLSGKDVATVTKELRAVLDELDKLPAAEGVSTRDDLAARRAERRAAAS